jgi:hypothetical protein
MAVPMKGQRPGEGDRSLPGLARRGTGQLPDCGVINAGNEEMCGAMRLFKGTENYKSVTLR